MNAVYIMASGRDGTLYIGVTSDLVARVAQHREGVFEGFTKRYGVNLIERDNREWLDLFPEFFRERGPLARLQEPVPSM